MTSSLIKLEIICDTNSKEKSNNNKINTLVLKERE